MKIWKYGEMRDKVILDLGLQDETFVTPTEIVGYFNEALTEAEAELIELNQDYFRTKCPIPLVTGQGRYDLPANIYANKIRAITYHNGAEIYPVRRFRRRGEFESMELSDQYGSADAYMYAPVNDMPGQAQIELHPVSRETATPGFMPMVMWYIRNCARVPVIGEWCNPEMLLTATVNTGTSAILTAAGTLPAGNWIQGTTGGYPGSVPYVTGDQVMLKPAIPASIAPGGLTFGSTYFAIVTGNSIKLASTMALALANTPLTITTQGSGDFVLWVKAQQTIIDATLMDIPEFATFVMQWVKCRCMEKEGDPRLEMAGQLLIQQKKQMVDSLTNAIPDDDDAIQADFSHYRDMS